jgi:hypothetical protein
MKNYLLHKNELIKDLKNTKLSIAQNRALSNIWFHRIDRLAVSLVSQISLLEEGKQLLKMLEQEHH